ncbi:protein transport protein SEC31 homolog B-like [Cryptomeria japonica]|uniref:protein transport protein SEC31 homolog B-like n=1 Tax=Cryptomeria japonica TaxID=3369 RepID=UPI0027DAA2D5|nr:protein transport protein SEC31 homolog B-like [Cryptomeria japonica]
MEGLDELISRRRSSPLKLAAESNGSSSQSQAESAQWFTSKSTKKYSQREEWTVLCDELASRLATVGNTLAANLRYIYAGNIEKTCSTEWSESLTSEHDGKDLC